MNLQNFHPTIPISHIKFTQPKDACEWRQEGNPVVKMLLQYYSFSLTLLERGCYEGEVQPYRKTDYKSMMMIRHTNMS